MGLLDWLRRLRGDSAARASAQSSPDRPDPTPPQRRDRDEPTTFIAPPPPEPVEPTEVVPAAAGGDVATVALDPSEPDATTTVRIEEPAAAPSASGDSDATLVLPTPGGSTGDEDPDATLYLEVPRRVVATLEAVRGELLGETYELKEGENRLGRSPDADVVLPSMWISRAHAKIVCEGGRMELSSLSDKITSVDDEPAGDGTELRDGCKIQLGGTLFRLQVAE